MAQMDYFRRPQLAGKNISRLKVGTIRGSVRRADPDGFSSVPYFPGVVPAQTLNISLDGAPIVVNLTANDLNTVIADITTALGAGGRAYPADGCIALQTNTIGTAGSIAVTGGTAATLLGFEVAVGAIRSTGGDVPTTPEGRVGNWFGVSFPNPGENLNSESVTRSLARLAANSDILFSEHMRCDALPKKVTFTTPEGKYLTPTSPTTVRAFTGYGLLSAASPKESLASFFFLVDQATNLPPASRVVGVVRGTPAGLPPYSDATTWTGGTLVGNVLGTDLVKVSSAITDIKNGRAIYAAGADFVTNIVVPGDFVSITGATNFTPWNNNGYRWVVEQVIDATHLAVRPMSFSELTQMGTVSTEEQPLVELNINRTGVETFGTLTVRTGTFTNDVKLVVDPPIPTGATYDLYVSQPGDIRSRKTFEPQAGLISNRDIASDLRPEPNCLITPPTITSWSATTVVMTSGYARFCGRVVAIPARNWTNADFSNAGSGTFTGYNYLYWNEATGNVEITRSPVKVFNALPARVPAEFVSDTPAANQLIAEVVKVGANITSVSYAGRSAGEDVRAVTVGAEGQFQLLEDAIRFVNAWDKNQGSLVRQQWNTSASYNDRYSVFEIVLTSDVTVTGTLPEIGTQGLKIRGINPSISLNFASVGPSYAIPIVKFGTFTFEDLTIRFDASLSGKSLISNYVTLFSGAVNIVLKNVTVAPLVGGSVITYLITGASLGKVVLDNCDIQNLEQSFLQGGDGSTNVYLLNSRFSMDFGAPLTDHQFISQGSFNADWGGKVLHVEGCKFTLLGTLLGPTEPVFGRFDNTLIMRDCEFFSALQWPVTLDSLLIRGSSSCYALIDGVRIQGGNAPARLFFNSDSPSSYVQNCRLEGFAPRNGGSIIKAAHVQNCYLTPANPGAGATPGIAIEGLLTVEGNDIVGTLAVGIKSTNVAPVTSNITVRICNNYLDLFTPTVGTVIGIQAHSFGVFYTRHSSIESNTIRCLGASSVAIKLNDGATNGLFAGHVRDNTIMLPTAVGNNNCLGIDADRANSVNIIGNNIISQTGAFNSTGVVGIGLSNGTGSTVVGNTVLLGALCKAITVAGAELSITSNYFLASVAAIEFTNSTQNTPVTGNYFGGPVVNLRGCSFHGNGVVGTTTTSSAQSPNNINDNNFFGNCTFSSGDGPYFVSGNAFGGANVSTPAGANAINFTNNIVEGGSHSLFSNYASKISDNHFILTTAVTCAGTFQDNTITGTGTFYVNGPGEVSDNQILCTGAVNLGDGFSAIRCLNNNISGSAGVAFYGNHFDGSLAFIDGNHFQTGSLTLGDLSRFSNNTVTGATSITIGGGWESEFSPSLRATIVGNIFKGVTTMTVLDCSWSGNTVHNATGAATFTRCDMSGGFFKSSNSLVLDICTISAMEVILTSSSGDMDAKTTQMSGCYIQCDDFSSRDCEIAGSEFFVVSFDNLSSSAYTTISGSRIRTASGGVNLSSSRQLLSAVDFQASGNSTFSGSGAVVELTSCRFSGSLSLGGQNVYVSTCEVLGTTSISTAGRVLIGQAQLVGAVTQSGACDTFQIGMSTMYSGISTSADSSYVYLNGCHVFATACTIAGGNVKIATCTFEKRVTFPGFTGGSGSINATGVEFSSGASVTTTAQGNISFASCRFVSQSTLFPTVGTPSTTGALYIKQQGQGWCSVEITNCDFFCVNGTFFFTSSTQDVPGTLLTLGDGVADIFWNVHVTGCKFLQNPTLNVFGHAGNNYVYFTGCIKGEGTLRHSSIIGNTMISPIGYVTNSQAGGFTTSYNWYGIYCIYFQNSMFSDNSMSYGSTWGGAFAWSPTVLAAYTSALQQGGTNNMFPNLNYSTYFAMQL